MGFVFSIHLISLYKTNNELYNFNSTLKNPMLHSTSFFNFLMVMIMDYCINYNDGTRCLHCGGCGAVMCREHSGTFCTECNYCELGGITYD